MSAEAAIYDYETIIASAVVNAFQAGGFQASMYSGQSDPEFQRVRPRVEIQFKMQGSEVPQRQWPDGTFRPMAFIGELLIAAITDSNSDGKTTHGDYRAKVRSFCGTMLPRVNNVSGGLSQHKIQLLTEQGTSQGFAPERGEETSVISYRLQFSLQGTTFDPALNVYYGVDADPTLEDPTDLSTLIQTSVSLAVTLKPAAQYLYFAFPDTFGDPLFTVNGLLNTAWNETAITVGGIDYNIFRSLNLLTGTYKIGVTPDG